MVEKIEELGPELRMHLFRQLDMLNDRKVGVIEAGPFDCIAAEIAEAGDSSEGRRIEPSLHAADDLDRAGDVRPNRVSYAVNGDIPGDNVHGIAALHLNDRSELPTLNIAFAVK